MLTKFASAEIIDIKGSPDRIVTANLNRYSDYDNYRTSDGYLYARIRAISSRTNKNHDGWPSIELAGSSDLLDKHKQSSTGFTIEASEGNPKYGFATFVGKPIFVDHNNSDPKRARGVIVDSKLNVLSHREASLDKYYSSGGADPEHLPPVEVELLLEIDAKKFPKFAKAVRSGDIDGFSMGCDVEYSKCSHCGNVATSPEEYCSHVQFKGAEHDYKTADGKKVSKKSYENCYKIGFFEISGVFDPADETALTKEIRAGIIKEAEGVNPFAVDEFGQSFPSGEMACPKCYGKGCEICGGKGSFTVPNAYDEGTQTPEEGRGMRPHPDNMLTRNPKEYPIEEWENPVYGKTASPDAEGNPWPWEVQHEPQIDENGQESIHLPPHYPNLLRYLEAAERSEPGQDTQRRITIQEIKNYLDHLGYPRESSTKTAENPLPQSFETRAPEHVDTLRDEQICDVCGNEMDGEKCAACGWTRPPEGMGNPDLTKARDVAEQMEGQDELTIPGDGAKQQAGPEGMSEGIKNTNQIQPGSFLQNKTRNPGPTASVTDEMRWQPEIHTGGTRINKDEKPLSSTSEPATNEPIQKTVIKDQTKPVTAAMLTAQRLIARAQRNHTGENMSERTADGSTAPDAAPDTRTDVTGVGGIIEPSNDAASSADAQVTVTDIGGTGVSDVEADSSTDLPTASEGSDDAGFNTDKNIEAIPTKTYDDSDGTEKGFSESVTNESLEGNQNKDSSARTALDSNPWPNDEIEGGSANRGVQPVDPIGKAQDRVDVLQAVTTPSNNSGSTTTWSGTDGNGVLRQQDPVTNELQPNNTDNAWTSHFIAALEVADAEEELGLISKEEKYNRLAELKSSSDEVIQNTKTTLARVKTAGLERLAAQRTSGVTKLPAMFGQKTASAGVGHYDSSSEGKFETYLDRTAGAETKEDTLPDEVLDAGLFG